MATGFHVYPDPQTAPLTVPAGQTSGDISIEEFTGADSTTASGLNTMFIRIATAGVAPEVILRAATGDPVTIPATNLTSSFSSGPGGSGTAMSAAMKQVSAGVYLLRVRFATIPAPSSPGFQWTMRLHNTNPAKAQDFTWVVASSDDEAKHPWLSMPLAPAGGTFDVPVNANPRDLSLPVQNLGTGPLEITDSAGTDLGEGFSIKTVPPPLAPLGSANLIVTFETPGAPGLSAVTYDVQSNDDMVMTTAGHNGRVKLVGKSVQFEVALVLDASGSMELTPAGTSPPSDQARRWSKLVTAACGFLDSLEDFGAGAGAFGVAVFPDVNQHPAPPRSAAVIFGPDAIGPSAIADAKAALLQLQPNGGTPMGAGIAAGMGAAGSWGLFSNDVDALACNRRWMVLMSDGKHNSGPPDPPAFYGSGLASFTAKQVKAFTVAYGDPGAWEVDHALLATIASSSQGSAADAGPDDAGLNLVKAFQNGIVAGLGISLISDPTGELTMDAPTHIHSFAVAPFERKISVVVSWGTADPERVRVELVTPLGETIDRDNLGDPDTIFHQGDRYQIFTFAETYLHDTFPPRSGNWRLIVGSDVLGEEGDREPYAYQVMTDSRLELATSFDRAGYAAGDPVEMTAMLSLDGAPVPDAAVSVHLTSPHDSVGNWLASQHVSGNALKNAMSELGEMSPEHVSPLRAKAYALSHYLNRPFDPFNSVDVIPMTYASDRGAYVARLSATAHPGTYDFYVMAIGQSADGTLFRREMRVRQRLEVLPDAESSLFETVYRRVDGDLTQADLRIWPRDRAGNALMLDPRLDEEEQREPRIRFEVSNADLIGEVGYELDGSYTQSVRYYDGAQPVVDVFCDDLRLIRESPLADSSRYRFADLWEDFLPGGEAEPGINVHTDPDAALGSVLRDAPGTFVALGALGALTVSVDGSLILGGDPDDVVVFVHPALEPRAYSVEARLADENGPWVELGVSPGTSKAFSLESAGLVKVEAVRIRDLSRRTFGDDILPEVGEALDAPGVGILGIGFRNVS